MLRIACDRAAQDGVRLQDALTPDATKPRRDAERGFFFWKLSRFIQGR